MSMHHKELSEAAKSKLRKQLGKAVEDWMCQGGEVGFNAFQIWVSSKYQTLPFSGGFLEQPEWVINDFTLYQMLLDLAYLTADLKETPNDVRNKD